MSALPAMAADLADLADQQRRLAALVTGDDTAACADDAPATAAVLRPLADAAPRLSIYRDAYRGRLVAALRANVPVLHRVLGDDAFADLALAYLADQPSREPSIRWFGHALAGWLQARIAAGDPRVPHPALADLVRMEWAIGTSFDAADAAPLCVDDLAAIAPTDWPALRFAAHPALRRVPLRWAVEPLWKALTADEAAATEPPEPLDHILAAWRLDLETRWRSLPADEDAALAACLAGTPFATLCEQVAEAGAGEEAALRVAGWLRGWVESGLLVARDDAAASAGEASAPLSPPSPESNP
jgi:hypothetical protein